MDNNQVTAEWIAQQRAVCEAATPGPWVSNEPYSPMVTAENPYGKGLMHIADIRGWGHLTGKGACALTDEKASEIQAANSAFIVSAKAGYRAALDALEASMAQEAKQRKRHARWNELMSRALVAAEKRAKEKDNEIARLTAERDAEKRRADAAVRDLREYAPFAATCEKYEVHRCGYQCQGPRCPGWEWRGPCALQYDDKEV